VGPAVCLIHFIAAAVTLLASSTALAQFSLPYNTVGRGSVPYSVLYSIVVLFLFEVFCGLNILLIMPVIFK